MTTEQQNKLDEQIAEIAKEYGLKYFSYCGYQGDAVIATALTTSEEDFFKAFLVTNIYLNMLKKDLGIPESLTYEEIIKMCE